MNAPASAADHRPPLIPDHELLRLIGRGSYGEVWLARNVMGSYRAVKIVQRDRFESNRPCEREFAGIQKYEPISRSHEGLVQVLHVGRAPRGDSFYYVMELADDTEAADVDPETYQPRTLRAEIERRGALPLDALLRAGLTLASGLEHLHRHGLIHRDVKPSNIIFVGGRAKIADIGLVSEVGESRSFVGTEGFIPPEGPGSPSADVFSLGKVLYEASTAKDRLSFPEIPQEWLTDERALPRFEFQEVVLKACESDATRRYQRAAELAADLALLQSGRSVRRLRALEWRLTWLKRAAAIALGAALVTSALYRFAVRQAQHDRDNLARVQRAESEARAQLGAARLAQARAMHHSGLAGQRFDCLDVLREAARVEPTLELRNEAISALCLPDFRVARRVRSLQAGSHALLDPTGAFYMTSGAGGLLTLFRVEDDAEVGWLHGALPAGWALEDLSPGGQFVLLRQPHGNTVLLSLARREKVLEAVPTDGWFQGRFSPEGTRFLWCGSHHDWNLVDLSDGHVVAQWPVANPVASFRFHPTLPLIAIARADEPVVELHDLQTHAVLRSWTFPSAQGELAWDRKGARLAGSGQDLAVRVWDALDGTNVVTLYGHENYACELAFHPDQPWLFTSSWDNTTRLWDLRTGRETARFPTWGTWLRLTADARQLCLCEWHDQELAFLDVASELACRTLLAPPGVAPFSTTYDIALDPSGRWLAAGFADRLCCFDTASLECVATAGERQIYCVTFSADGRELLWGGEAGLHRANVKITPGGSFALGEQAVVSPAAPIFAIVATQNGLIWNAGNAVVSQREGAPRTNLWISGQADSLCLSHDGRWLCASERWEPYSQYVWDAHNWSLRHHFVGDAPPDRAHTCFSMDDRELVVAYDSCTRFLRLADGQFEGRLGRSRRGCPWAFAACSPDGSLLAVTHTQGSIGLYDYSSRRLLAVLQVPKPANLARLAFDPTGNHLAAGCAGREAVLIWDLPLLRRHLASLGLDW